MASSAGQRCETSSAASTSGFDRKESGGELRRSDELDAESDGTGVNFRVKGRWVTEVEGMAHDEGITRASPVC